MIFAIFCDVWRKSNEYLHRMCKTRLEPVEHLNLTDFIFAIFDSMKKAIGLILCLISLSASAQLFLYKGDGRFDRDIAFTIQNGTVYHGDNRFNPMIYYTISENQVFLGRSTMQFDCLYTVKDNKVYRGNSTFSSDILYTIEDQKVYRGNSTFSTECLLTFEDDKIYRGDSTFPTDLLFTISGKNVLSVALLACIVGPY